MQQIVLVKEKERIEIVLEDRQVSETKSKNGEVLSTSAGRYEDELVAQAVYDQRVIMLGILGFVEEQIDSRLSEQTRFEI